MTPPRTDDLWRYKQTGDLYKVVGIAEGRGAPYGSLDGLKVAEHAVVYRRPGGVYLYYRLLADFEDKFERYE